jgi:hypothetical protein
MTRTTRPSSSVPSTHLGEIHTENQPRDTVMGGTTRPSSPVQPETQGQPTKQQEHRTPRPSRPSSPAPTETPTEVATEAASFSALKNSRKSCQRENATSFSNNNFSQHQSTSLHTPQASFNHTTESPVLGSTQRLPVAPDISPLTPLAESHSDGRTNARGPRDSKCGKS